MDISVVTAVYNGEEYLEECIESILKQTFIQFEYIIVNDGSDDKTKEILDRITDPRVRVFHLEKNGGAANALNIGINEAKGKWIALQDADDVSSVHRLQRQLQYIQSDSKFVAIGSLIQCIPGNDEVDLGSFEKEEHFFNSKKNVKNDQFYSTPICNGTGFFLKSAFKSIGGYDPTFKIAYDYDLWTRMFEVGEISRVPEILYKYRIHGNSLAHSNKIHTTIEVLLSSFKNISELRFKHLQRKPKMLLVGTEKSFKFYRENLEHHNHFLIMSFDNDVEKAYSLFQANEIDGIIVDSKKRRMLHFFRRKGLSFQKNLFKIWIPQIF